MYDKLRFRNFLLVQVSSLLNLAQGGRVVCEHPLTLWSPGGFWEIHCFLSSSAVDEKVTIVGDFCAISSRMESLARFWGMCQSL